MDKKVEEFIAKKTIEVPVTGTGIISNGKGVFTYAIIEIPTKKRMNRGDKVKVIIL